MATKRLTDAAIKRIKPPPGPGGEVTRADYWDKLDGGGSLGLRVTSRGIKTWVAIPRALRNGKRIKVRVTLGHYPAMSLAQARDAARRAFVLAPAKNVVALPRAKARHRNAATGTNDIDIESA